MLTKRLFSVLALVVAFVAQGFAQVRFHNEGADTLRINDMLILVSDQKLPSSGDRIAAFGLKFLDIPYVAHTLEYEPEMLTVNVDELDCTTFVETVMALAMTVNERRTSWRDFVYNLQHLRYRGGQVKGYPSRLHYNADWAVDNTYRGNIKDVTSTFPRYSYVVKTINFMSANADRYSALADSANLAGIKNVEIGYRGHRFPYIKSGDLASKEVRANFENGDILAFTSNIKNLDVTHMGILIIKDGVPYVLHASSSAGKVVLSDVPLADFMKRNRQFTGMRVFRLAH